MTPEGKFKAHAKKILVQRFPGCWFHEMKCGNQGIPDTLMLFHELWALLEFKESATAAHQPNQDYYISMFNKMGFASFVYPENFNDVIKKLEKHFYPL